MNTIYIIPLNETVVLVKYRTQDLVIPPTITPLIFGDSNPFNGLFVATGSCQFQTHLHTIFCFLFKWMGMKMTENISWSRYLAMASNGSRRHGTSTMKIRLTGTPYYTNYSPLRSKPNGICRWPIVLQRKMAALRNPVAINIMITVVLLSVPTIFRKN